MYVSMLSGIVIGLMFIQGCSHSPSTAEFNTLKAEMYLRAGETEHAQKYLTIALESDAEFIEAHILQSKIYMIQDNPDKAIQQLEKARTIDGKNLDILYSLGFIYTRKRDYDKALSVYNDAIASRPDTALGYNNIAVTYHSKKEFAKAIEYYKKALKIDSNFVEAHYNIGNSYAMMNKFQEAINAYNTSVQLDPKYTDAYAELSSVYQKIGNKAEAGNNVGLYYFWKEQYDKAVKAFDDVVKAYPNHAVAYNNLAVTYDKLGNSELSLENLKKSAVLGYTPAIEICRKNNIAF